jgi:chromosome segregation ATPase
VFEKAGQAITPVLCCGAAPLLPLLQELQSSLGDASSSLMRQIRTLTEQAASAQASAAEQERQLVACLRAAEQAAADALDAERDAAGRAASAEAALQAARDAAAAAVHESAGLRSRLEAAHRHSRMLEAERNAAQERLAAAQAREQALAEVRMAFVSVVLCLMPPTNQPNQPNAAAGAARPCPQELQQQRSAAREQEQAASHTLGVLTQERDELAGLVKQLQQQLEQAQAAAAQPPSQQQQGQEDPALGPVLSVGVEGLALGDPVGGAPAPGSASAPGWSLQGALSDVGALQAVGSVSNLSSNSGSPMAAGRSGNGSRWQQQQQQQRRQLSGSLPGAQSPEARVQQLQQELAAVARERDAAAEQMYQAVRQADAAAAALREMAALRQAQAELQHKLDTSLEVLGERSLRCEELEADIADMKAVFAAQLEEAVQQLAACRQQQDAAAEAPS